VIELGLFTGPQLYPLKPDVSHVFQGAGPLPRNSTNARDNDTCLQYVMSDNEIGVWKNLLHATTVMFVATSKCNVLFVVVLGGAVDRSRRRWYHANSAWFRPWYQLRQRSSLDYSGWRAVRTTVISIRRIQTVRAFRDQLVVPNVVLIINNTYNNLYFQ